MRTTNGNIILTLASIRAIPPLKKSAAGKHALARNISVLAPFFKDISDTRNAVAKELFGAEKPTPDHPRWHEFEAACRELDAIEVDVPVHKFKLEALNLSENDDLDHEHLSAIAWLIEDF